MTKQKCKKKKKKKKNRKEKERKQIYTCKRDLVASLVKYFNWNDSISNPSLARSILFITINILYWQIFPREIPFVKQQQDFQDFGTINVNEREQNSRSQIKRYRCLITTKITSNSVRQYDVINYHFRTQFSHA